MKQFVNVNTLKLCLKIKLMLKDVIDTKYKNE